MDELVSQGWWGALLCLYLQYIVYLGEKSKILIKANVPFLRGDLQDYATTEGNAYFGGTVASAQGSNGAIHESF